MVHGHRQTKRLPPSFYLQQRDELAVQGRTRPKAAANTKKSLASTLSKWQRFCSELGYDPDIFLQEAQVPDFRVFWRWTLDRHKRIRTASSLKNYWRVLRMHILNTTDRDFDPREKRDIHNYLNLLLDEYDLRTVPKKKPVIDLDDLYLLLYTHWVLDDRTYDDERQRVQVAAGLLAAVFFGCRPCSLFDTRVKFDDETGDLAKNRAVANSPSETKYQSNDIDMDIGGETKRRGASDHAMVVGLDCNVDSNSSTACDGDSDSHSSTAYGGDSDSDSDAASVHRTDGEDCDTDDDCTAGLETTRAFLYRHFTITIVPHQTPGNPNLIFMKATLLHTKGEDNNPRIKTLVIDGEDDDPVFSLLDHLISLAISDDAFEAESAKEVENMFWVKIPPNKKSLTLKWKRRILDCPVFREPLRGAGESGTSFTEPLRASTWIRYLKRLGQTAGFQQSFTQYGLRRGLLNVVNNKAPASVRDQIFDHKPGAVKYYLDQEVRFDTKACYLGRPSNDVVQRMARLASLMADASAPTELSPGQKAKLSRHPEVIRLCQRNKALTARIHAAGYRPIGAAKGTRLYEKKKTAEARLNCFKTRLRTDMMEKARKRHFRKADTIAFDAQFSGAQTSSLDVQPAGPIQYQLPERAAVVRLTCTPSDGLTEQGKLTRRIEAITARAALCRRQETRRRRGPEPPIDPDESDAVWADPDAGEEHQFPVVCKPTQCIFCLGDERKLYQGRIAEYSRPNKMMNEAERHLTGFASESPIPCPHPRCKASGLVRPQAMAFKSHTAKVHKIMLRA